MAAVLVEIFDIDTDSARHDLGDISLRAIELHMLLDQRSNHALHRIVPKVAEREPFNKRLGPRNGGPSFGVNCHQYDRDDAQDAKERNQRAQKVPVYNHSVAELQIRILLGFLPV